MNYKKLLPLLFFSVALPQQEAGANTTNDEPLTGKELKSRQSIDGIAAFVGDKTILKSDINQALSMAVFQRRLNPDRDGDKILQLKQDIVRSVVNRKVVLMMAELDSILISDKEIDRTLEDQINNIVAQAGSEDEAEKALGQPLSVFRREYWYDIKDMMIAQKYQQGLIGKVSVNKKEVVSFFQSYQDSIPPFPTTVKLRHLLVKIEPGPEQINKTVDLLKSLRKKILSGEVSFEDVATQYSQDPGSKNSGGSLGFVRRGNLVTEFESIAFTLKPGEISLPVKTEFGYHIIETEEVVGEKIKVRHVLLSPPLTDKDESIAYEKALSLKDSSKTILAFISTIKQHSMDSQTKESGGSLGWVDPANYPIPEFGVVLGQINQNECAGPIQSEYGYHLLWVEASKPGGQANLSKHWNQIESLALNKKRGEWFESWVGNARKSFFINILD
ncbi:MAG: peptidylprolyl isomerase [Candidatus Marinimicrobia bacterium]|nr:peptidylprolyl isomerase [Candidatus Neomarinimicrobiota bacterium]